MKHSFMLDPALKPVSEGKMLGRVRTLKLGALEGTDRNATVGDAWKGIYNALDSYKFVRSGTLLW